MNCICSNRYLYLLVEETVVCVFSVDGLFVCVWEKDAIAAMSDMQSTRANARRILGLQRIAALSERSNVHGWIFFLGHLTDDGA